MKKEPFAFHMEAYTYQNPQLKQLPPCLVLSKPSGFDLNRYFPAQWRYKTYDNIQTNLPKICSDQLLIQTAKRNAECRQRAFVKNFILLPPEYQDNPVTSMEFARKLRKELSISTLYQLLFSNFEIFVLKSGCMEGFVQAKKDEITMESWIKANGACLDLDIVEGTERILSPYETNLIGYIVIPHTEKSKNITLNLLKSEINALNDYHKKNYIFSTKHL